MKLVVVASLIASAPAARADIAAEVSAGAGADTTAPAGFATTSVSLAARAVREPVPIFDRGLVLSDPDHPDSPGRFWIFTGLEADDRDGAGVSADGTLHAEPDGERSRTAWFAGRAWARGAGWQLALHGDLQPVGDLRDRFWRSGRGIAQLGVAVEIPAMWALGTERVQLLAWLTQIDVGRRLALDGDGAHDTGWDRDATITGARVQTPHVAVDLITFRYTELGVATSRVGDVTYGSSATALDCDVATLHWRLADALALTAYAGIAMRSPVSPYMQAGSTETSSGPAPIAPRYGLELRTGTALEPGAHGYTASLGAGSWTRLDPTGHAVDDGELATASADWRDGRYRVAGELEAGRLERLVVGDLAPPGIAPAGTRYVMGRGTVQASVRVTPAVAVTADAWVERSDRDDPRWLVPATGALASHAGADVTAVWRFERR